ncbi:MAG: DNA polymerase III subunit beta [Clostridia bacterium]|nr:DNA polymerase III subunit beta [Clostridia bacterium]
MKIIFDKNELIDAMTPALGAVSDKNTISAIEGILFTTAGDDACILSAYDLEKGYRTRVKARVEEEGSFIINAVKLYRMVRMMPGPDVTIEVGQRFMTRVQSGVAQYSLSAMPGADFPSLPDLEGAGQVVMRQATLKKMLAQTVHAIAAGTAISQRPILSGAYFKLSDGVFTMVTCDGNRMALRERESGFTSDGQEYSFIVPGKTLGELQRILASDGEDEVSLTFGRKHVIFHLGESIFFSRLIDGDYIDYRRVTPKNNRIKVILDRQDLIASLERVSLVTDDKSVGQLNGFVKCTFEGDTLKVSSTSSVSSINDEMEIEKTGDDIVIGLNCRYFLDALRSISDEKICIMLGTPLTSIVIEKDDTPAEESDENGKKEDEGTYLYMVCPVKMKD